MRLLLLLLLRWRWLKRLLRLRLRMLLRRNRWRWSWLLVLLLLLIHSKEMRRVLLRVLLRLHLRMVGVTRRLDVEGLMWVAIAVLSWVRRMLKLLPLVVRRCRITRLLLLLLMRLNLLPRLMLNNQSLLSLLGFPNGFGRRRLQLRRNKLANFTRQILLHLFVNDAVMFDERTYGLILGLVGASFVRAPERLCRGQFFGQFRLEVALGEVPPEVALGLAQITAEVALDHIGGGRRRVGVFDERIAGILRLLRNAARTRTRRRSWSSAVVTEWRHVIADLDEVAVLRLLLEYHGTLLRIPGSLHMMRRRLKMVRMLIPALLLLLLLLLLVKGKLRVIRTDHF